MDMSSNTATSLEHLETLLADGKVSQADYATLRAAMDARAERGTPAPVRTSERGNLRKCWANRQLGGVCAGLGERIGIDPWTIRAVFILAFLLSGGGALWVYILLYFVIPWKESERDQVARISFGFAPGVLALWFSLHLVIWLIRYADQFNGDTGGRSSIQILTFSWASFLHNPICVVIQIMLLVGLVGIHSLAPMNSRVRQMLPRAVCGGMVLIILVISTGYALGALLR